MALVVQWVLAGDAGPLDVIPPGVAQTGGPQGEGGRAGRMHGVTVRASLSTVATLGLASLSPCWGLYTLPTLVNQF